jgi:Raf kinase inhibitor-like YbhB/YbcL family protein
MKAHVKSLPLFIILVSLAHTRPAVAQSTQKLSVTSSVFKAGATIPVGCSCSGEGVSPPLSWRGVPGDAKTIVLILKDPDAPHGTFIHWVVYNLPASLGGLDANVPPTGKLANGGLQGVNSLERIGYKGPCPPPGSAPHHYHFELSALDTALNLKPGATAAQVEAAAQGHVKAAGDLVGTFAR